jgi:transcriptional regulator with XRE-family HTH domain
MFKFMELKNPSQTTCSPAVWRQSEKLSMAAVAGSVGVAGKNPARTWHRWESGELEPPLRVIALIEETSKGKVPMAEWVKVRSAYLSAQSAKRAAA